MKAKIFKKNKKGHVVDNFILGQVKELLGNTDFSADMLIEHLHIIQDHYGYINDKHIVALANLMRLTPVEVYEVASFYHHFDVIKKGEPTPPEITVRVCESMSCQMADAEGLITKLSQHYQNAVRIQRVPCVGACDKAPVAVVGKNRVDHANADAIKTLVKNQSIHAQPIVNHIDYDKYMAEGGYQTLAKIHANELTGTDIITTLKDANLRGLGGAGFPTGLKWEIVSKEKAPRMLVVNLDEGEPGTIKDGVYLAENPHQFLEGMLIAAKVVDCMACYIYIRDEYPAQYQMLLAEIAKLQQQIDLPLPPIHVRRGAGAYICGEESALIESIEGKRGMPRLRPPFVANVGLFGRPTLVNNFETLYWITTLINKGADWFTSHGANGRKGLRSYSVSGRVKNPGVHLAPAGTTIKELIDNYCGGMLDGHEFYGYFPGGASGGILPARLGDIPLDFDTLQEYGCFIGSAAVIIFSNQDKAKDMAVNAMNFFKHESCGQCTPCSVGTDKACGMMQQPTWDKPLLKELSGVMQDASICGLGQAAPNPLLSVLKYFPEELS